MSFTDNYVFALGAAGGGILPPDSRVWYSVDAQTWVMIDFKTKVGESQPIISMALTINIAMAVSKLGAVYKSADLTNWSAVDLSAYLTERSAVWSGQVGTGWLIVVTGRSYNNHGDLVPAYALSSDHGSTWSSHLWTNSDISNYDVVNRVKSLSDGYIYALGYTWNVVANTYNPFIYRSSDGVAWTSINTPPMT